MTWLAPWALAAGAVAVLAIAALHLLSRRRPPGAPLPTARFVPTGSARATRRLPRPTDLLLLLLRVAALALVAAAFAQPVPPAGGGRRARVVMVEDTPAARKAARRWARGGDMVVRFADSARAIDAAEWIAEADTASAEESRDTTVVIPSAARDLAPARRPAPTAPRLSPALAAALGAATSLAARVDSIEMVLVASRAFDVDAATIPLRDAWPGAVKHVPVRRAASDSTRAAPRPRVVWPRAGETSPSPAAIVAWDNDRSAYLPLPRRTLPEGTAIARWDDGLPAVVEVASDSGCTRHVGFPATAPGDLLLRPNARRLLERLDAPCGAPPADSAATARVLATFTRGDAQVATATLAGVPRRSPYSIRLLAGAVLLLLAEPLLRRARRDEDAA